MDIELGMLVIRMGIGLMLLAHGWNKVFGEGGISGTTRWFQSLGLHPAWLHARIAAGTEIVAGVLICLGLLNSLGTAAVIGLMTVATFTDHRGKGYFVFKGGCEYTLLVAAVAAGMAAVGPGGWSLDHVAGLDLSGPWWAVAAVILGTISGVVLLVSSLRPHQPSDVTDPVG